MHVIKILLTGAAAVLLIALIILGLIAIGGLLLFCKMLFDEVRKTLIIKN